jgi:hypothetical protein
LLKEKVVVDDDAEEASIWSTDMDEYSLVIGYLSMCSGLGLDSDQLA